MSTVEPSCQQHKLIDPRQFKLEDDDFYDDRCGEIFITTNRVLVLNCFICGSRYGNMSNFLEHWTLQHEDRKIYHSDSELDVLVDSSNENVEKNEINSELLSDDTIEVCHTMNNTQKSKGHCVDDLDNYSKKNLFTCLVDNSVQHNVSINFKKRKCFEKTKTMLENEILDQISNRRKKLLSDSCKLFECDKCRKTFRNPSSLRYHAAVHSEERKFKCTLCNSLFKDKSNLRAHMRRHTGEKNFTCDFCDKRFFSSTQTAIHRRIHTGERPFICSQCGRACISSSELSVHTQRHNNFRPHKCSLCERAFYTNNLLKIHMSVHTKERPFACSFCSSKFSRRQTLKAHLKLHANIKEYACNLCEKSFNQRPALLSHLRIRHKVVDHEKKDGV